MSQYMKIKQHTPTQSMGQRKNKNVNRKYTETQKNGNIPKYEIEQKQFLEGILQ